MNSKKFLNRIFRRINGLVWDVVSGNVGLQTSEGIYTVSFDAEGVATVNVNPLDDFGISLPAFATQSTLEEVAVGEIVVGDSGILGWVTDKVGSSLKVVDHNGHHKTYSPPKVAIMGTQGVLVVRNLMSLTGGAAGTSNFASSLLPLLALGGGDEKLESLLPILLMTSQNTPAGTAAPASGPAGFANLLPFLLLKDGGLGDSGGKMDKLLPLMMMGGLGGGNGGMNPIMMMALLGDNDLFGGSAKKTVPLAAASPLNRTGIPTLNRDR